MKSVEQDSPQRVIRRLPAWVFLGAFACLGVGGLLILRSRSHHESVHVQSQSANSEQSREIDRLKQAVSLLEHKSAALAVAVSSSQQDAAARPMGNPLPKPAEELKDTRTAAEVQQAEVTELEVRFTAEKDGSRDNLLAAQAMQAELRSAPLSGARVTGVECSTSLCRTTLEQDVTAKPLDMTALIDATPSVKRESMFDYAEEGAIKRVTIYSAREGHKLIPPAPNDASRSTAN